MAAHVLRLAVVLVLFAASPGCKDRKAADGATDLSSPKAAAKTFSRALERNDVAAAKSAALMRTPQQEQFVEAFAAMAGAIRKLGDAATKKFGDDGKIVVRQSKADELSTRIDDADVTTTDDTAVLTSKNSSERIKVKQVGGQWKVDVESMTAGPDATAAIAFLRNLAAAAEQTAREIDAGSYKTAQEAQLAMSGRTMSAAVGRQ